MTRSDIAVDPYLRDCGACGRRLQYRSTGPAGATATESYCANRRCPCVDETVENLHVS